MSDMKKIKKPLLKKFIKEVIKNSMELNEYNNLTDASFFVSGGDEITVEEFQLDDGRFISFTADILGTWDSGEFSHEFGTSTIGPQFDLEGYIITHIQDEDTKENIWLPNHRNSRTNQELKAAHPEMYEEIMSYLEQMRDKITQDIYENPPEDDNY